MRFLKTSTHAHKKEPQPAPGSMCVRDTVVCDVRALYVQAYI